MLYLELKEISNFSCGKYYTDKHDNHYFKDAALNIDAILFGDDSSHNKLTDIYEKNKKTLRYIEA